MICKAPAPYQRRQSRTNKRGQAQIQPEGRSCKQNNSSTKNAPPGGLALTRKGRGTLPVTDVPCLAALLL